ATICGPCPGRIVPEAGPRVPRAFVKEDPGEPGPRRNYGLPTRDDPGFDAAAAEALLEAAGEGETASAERATGYYWGESKLRPYVERILERAQAAGVERLERRAHPPSRGARRVRFPGCHVAPHRSRHEASSVAPCRPGPARPHGPRPWWTGRARRDPRAVPRDVDSRVAYAQAGPDRPPAPRRDRQC